MSDNNVRFVTLPSVWGAEWREASGTRFQFVAVRGGNGVSMGVLAKGNVEWSTIRVEQPERFGPMPIASANAFRAWVEAFFDASDTESKEMLDRVAAGEWG
jgi:hypothetical protein